MISSKELLEELTLEDIKSDEAYELAECIGLEAFKKIVFIYGGTGKLYIPLAHRLCINIRNRKIQDDYFNSNMTKYDIAKKYDITDRTVHNVILDDFRYTKK
ncbi:MAG: Mor transcription activator family protein [Oscillospiraceae bacterium]